MSAKSTRLCDVALVSVGNMSRRAESEGGEEGVEG